MALELFMVGLIVQEMDKSLEFYRRLGLEIPEGSEQMTHVEIKMGSGLTFFLDSRPKRWDPSPPCRPHHPTTGGERNPKRHWHTCSRSA